MSEKKFKILAIATIAIEVAGAILSMIMCYNLIK